jgi:hypothetical protein
MIYDRQIKRGLPLGDLRPVNVELSKRTRWLVQDATDPRLEHRTLQQFQRWAIRKYYTVIPFESYDGSETKRLPEWGQARFEPTSTESDAL